MVLADILRPIRLEPFRRDYYTQRALHIPDQPTKFAELFTWDSLNRILNSAPIPHPTMQLVLSGRRTVPANAIELIESCRAGATMIVDRVDKYDQKVADLASALGSEMHEPIRVNLYYSQPSKPGFNRHYDTHDVFILQIAGFKGWRVFEPTVEYPLFELKEHSEIPPTSPYLDCTLAAGDVLYVPRGHWHEATAQVESSLHLTIGIYARTGIDFLLWLVDELRGDVQWREAFPLEFRETLATPGLQGRETIAHLERLTAALTGQLRNVESVYQRYQRYCIARDRKRRPFKLPEQVDRPPVDLMDSSIISRLDHQRTFLERNSTSGEVEISVWGRIMSFDPSAFSALAFIFRTPSFTFSELLAAAPECSREHATMIATALKHEGIIEINPFRLDKS